MSSSPHIPGLSACLPLPRYQDYLLVFLSNILGLSACLPLPTSQDYLLVCLSPHPRIICLSASPQIPGLSLVCLSPHPKIISCLPIPRSQDYLLVFLSSHPRVICLSSSPQIPGLSPCWPLQPPHLLGPQSNYPTDQPHKITRTLCTGHVYTTVCMKQAKLPNCKTFRLLWRYT